MLHLTMPPELENEPISWYQDEKIIAYLEKKGVKTVGESVDRQAEFSKKMWGEMKVKIGYVVLQVKPVSS